MEAWIPQLEMEMEMEWDEESIMKWCNGTISEQNVIETMLGEEVVAACTNSAVSAESNTSSPSSLDHLDYLISTPEICSIINGNLSSEIHQISAQQKQITSPFNTNGLDLDDESHKQRQEDAGRSRVPKRKRQPNQVQDHIMAERKRRELLSQRFIALSAIVPGLKKTDKTSVLGEAIKYLRQLQEKVKELEHVTAKYSIESVVMVKRSRLVVPENEDGDNHSSSSSTYDHHATESESLPQIEVKMSDKSLLFRFYCQKKKGILPKLFSNLEKHALTVLNTSIIPFGSLALDITILAQMEMGLDSNVKEIIKSLESTIRNCD